MSVYRPWPGFELGVGDPLDFDCGIEKRVRFFFLRLRLAATFNAQSQTWRTKCTLKERFLGGSFRYLHSENALEYRKHFSIFGFVCATLWSRWDLPDPHHPQYHPHHHSRGGGSSGSSGRLHHSHPAPLHTAGPRRRAAAAASGTSASASASSGRGRAGGWGWARPSVGCGLVLGEWPGRGLVGRLPLLLVRPLTHTSKCTLHLTPNVRLKTYYDTTLRLPRRLSLWVAEGGAGAAESYNGGGGYADGDGYADGADADGGGGGAGDSASLSIKLRRAAVVLEL